jgi:glycosyltransferase involved in cell wall biosynthesis
MRIALLSTSRIGGAGIASIRSSEALKSIGVENDLFALANGQPTPDKQIHTISRTLAETFQSQALTVVQKKLIQRGSDLLTPLSLQPKVIGKIIESYDLIHLHATYNILRHSGLESLLRSGKKIVITLHDQRWFTGGCHYSGNCDQYKDDCRQCPQSTAIGKHLVSKSLQKCASLFQSHPNTKVISPSLWLGEKARQSKILAEANIRIIRNPIPTFESQIFQNQDAKDLSFQFPTKKIVFIADNLQNPLKGLDTLLNAFKVMNTDARSNFELLLIGNNPPDLIDVAVRTRTVSVNNSEKISRLLHQSHLLAVPSREDNLPNVIGEAYASGIKVIGSDIGGIPEVITAETGKTFQSGNHLELSDRLLEFDYNYSKQHIKSYFDSNFSYSVVGKQLNDFYQE